MPGSFDIEETKTGIRWRYSKADKLNICEESISDRVKSNLAFKSVSALFIQNLDWVKIQVQNLGN